MINKGEIVSWATLSPEIKKGLRGAYLLFGDDDYIKNSIFHLMYNQIMGDGTFADFNYTKISFILNEDPFTKLDDSSSSLPMMQDQSLIEVRELNFTKIKESEIKNLEQVLKGLGDETVLVFICLDSEFEYDKRFTSTSLYKNLGKYITFVDCSHLDKIKYSSWISKKAMSEKCVLSSEAQAALYELTKGDMLASENELNKLISYSLSQSKSYIVSEEDVKNLCSSLPSEEIDFELNNACSSWNIKEIMACIQKAKDRQEEPIVTLTKLETIYSDMLDMKIAIASGMTPKDASKALNMNEYRGAKLYEAVSKPPISLIEYALKESLNADIRAKSSNIDTWLIIDELIVKIYTPKGLR